MNPASDDNDEPDGQELADRLYGGGIDVKREDRPVKGRAYYGCNLDENGNCRRAGTEHCDLKCPHSAQ